MKPFLIRALALTFFIAAGFSTTWITWEFSLARHKTQTCGPLQQGVFPPHQTWTLSAQGGQSLVFFSEDGKFVLKFFKDQPRPYLKWPSYLALKNKKLARTLSGYTLVQERCPEISATVLLHFEKTDTLLPATLIDRIGIAHSIDLAGYVFVVQRRAQPLTPPASREGRVHLLSQISTLLQTVTRVHLKDHDPRLHLNLGYVDGKLVITDPGRIAHAEESSYGMTSKLLNFAEIPCDG